MSAMNVPTRNDWYIISHTFYLWLAVFPWARGFLKIELDVQNEARNVWCPNLPPPPPLAPPHRSFHLCRLLLSVYSDSFLINMTKSLCAIDVSFSWHSVSQSSYMSYSHRTSHWDVWRCSRIVTFNFLFFCTKWRLMHSAQNQFRNMFSTSRPVAPQGSRDSSEWKYHLPNA